MSIIGQSVTVFLVAFSLSQLASGIMCDYINKQRFLFCGILVFIAGTIMVALAHDQATFLTDRVLQGLGCRVGLSRPRGLSRQLSGLVGILAYCYITFFFNGIAMPCSVTIMLGNSEASAVFLAALAGFFHLTGTAIDAYTVALLTLGSTASFSLATCALSIAKITIYFTLKKH